jgi:hypothetical protein
VRVDKSPSGHRVVLCDEAEAVNELLHLDMAPSAHQGRVNVVPIGASVEQILIEISRHAPWVFGERLDRANVQECWIVERTVQDAA